MKKILRHGRNSKPSSGGDVGGKDTNVYVLLYGIFEQDKWDVLRPVYIGDVNQTYDYGKVNLSYDDIYVSGDPLELAILGNFPAGTILDFNIYGSDMRGVSSINGITDINNVHIVKKFTIQTDNDDKDIDDVSFNPKQYIITLFSKLTSDGSDSIYIPVSVIIGNRTLIIDIYLLTKVA